MASSLCGRTAQGWPRGLLPSVLGCWPAQWHQPRVLTCAACCIPRPWRTSPAGVASGTIHNIQRSPLIAGVQSRPDTVLQEGECPVAVLVGVDATPSPGLRGPTNFAGTLRGADIEQLDAELARHRCLPLHLQNLTRKTTCKRKSTLLVKNMNLDAFNPTIMVTKLCEPVHACVQGPAGLRTSSGGVRALSAGSHSRAGHEALAGHARGGKAYRDALRRAHEA